MSAPISAQFAWWPQIPESPEALEAQRRNDENFKEREKKADFWKAADDFREAFWWIWDLDPEESQEKAEEARALEDPEDPDIALEWLDGAYGFWEPEGPEYTWDNIQIASLNPETPLEKNSERNPENYERNMLENIHTPLIIEQYRKWNISWETRDQILHYFTENSDTKWIPDISGIDTNEAQQITKFLDYIDTEEASKKARDLFEQNFGDQFEEFQNEKGEFRTEKQHSVYEMIASQYFPIWESAEESHSTKQQELAMDAAIQTAFNMEIDGKIFPRTKQFQELSDTVRDNTISLEKRFQAFIDVTSIVDRNQGRGWKKQADLYRKSKQNEAESDVAQSHFNAEQVELIQEPKSNKKPENTWEEAPTGDTDSQWGEVFAWGNLDRDPDTGPAREAKNTFWWPWWFA